MPRTFYSQIWSHSFYPYSGVLRNWDPIKMTYLLCHLHGKECCSLRCASSTAPWQCPNWIHLTDSMRNNRNCCSFLFIFYRVGLIYYTLEIFFLQYNAKQLLFQTANCQYKRNHTFHLIDFIPVLSDIYMTGLHSGGTRKSDSNVESANGLHRWNPWGWGTLFTLAMVNGFNCQTSEQMHCGLRNANWAWRKWTQFLTAYFCII